MIGPRRRRRLAAAGIVLLVLAAIAAAAVLFARSPDHSGRGAATDGSTTPVEHTVSVGPTAKLVYGMTRREVRARIGRPSTTLVDRNGSPCWQYDIDRTFRGLNGVEHTWNAVRVCFLDGRYSLDYSETDGKWDYTLPKIKVTS